MKKKNVLFLFICSEKKTSVSVVSGAHEFYVLLCTYLKKITPRLEWAHYIIRRNLKAEPREQQGGKCMKKK